jgi:hypothetical protein
MLRIRCRVGIQTLDENNLVDKSNKKQWYYFPCQIGGKETSEVVGNIAYSTNYFFPVLRRTFGFEELSFLSSRKSPSSSPGLCLHQPSKFFPIEDHFLVQPSVSQKSGCLNTQAMTRFRPRLREITTTGQNSFQPASHVLHRHSVVACQTQPSSLSRRLFSAIASALFFPKSWLGSKMRLHKTMAASLLAIRFHSFLALVFTLRLRSPELHACELKTKTLSTV